jgi:hypothetical protein
LIDDMLEIGMNAEGCDIQCPYTESRTSYMETVRDIAREGVMLLGERSKPGSESEHATRRSAESAYTMFALEQGSVWLPEVDWDSVEPLEALATGMEHFIVGRREPPVDIVVPGEAVQNAEKV